MSIFTPILYAVRFDGEMNALEKLMELWTDTEFLYNYAKENNVKSIDEFIDEITEAAERIQDLIHELNKNDRCLETYFQALTPSARNFPLKFHKGKLLRSRLRVYAIKIDRNCYLITGGAIKLSRTMQEHAGTNNELMRLEQVKQFLIDNHVHDELSFFELIDELML